MEPMHGVRILDRSWRDSLANLVASARRQLTIVAPFISSEGGRVVTDQLSESVREAGTVDLITDLSPAHIQDGSLETQTIGSIMDSAQTSRLWHIPRLHAKLYVADSACAIVTSGNLTAAALFRNVEYGVEITNRALLKTVESDLAEFRTLGTTVAREQFQQYAVAAKRVREAYVAQKRRVDRALQEAFAEATRRAEDELVRFRLAGGTMHAVFARTVSFLLQKHGPMATPAIHALVQSIHPDLCDDTVDRVIEGRRYGKKWKHVVRTAQQHLKRCGLAEHKNGLWQLSENRG